MTDLFCASSKRRSFYDVMGDSPQEVPIVYNRINKIDKIKIKSANKIGNNFFLFFNFGGHKSSLWATDNPVLDFW